MGNQTSRFTKEKSGKTANGKEIPPDSPLGRKLSLWTDSSRTKDLKKETMIKYCCFIWTKEPIRAPSVVWSEYGSDEDWVCQILNVYVNRKQPFDPEESKYAAAWLAGDGESPTRLYPLTPQTDPRKPQKSWDILTDGLPPSSPPPYIPPAHDQASSADLPPATDNSESQQATTSEEGTAGGCTGGGTELTPGTRKSVRLEMRRGREEGLRAGRSDNIEQLNPLREVPFGNERTGFVVQPLNSGDIRQLRNERPRLLDDPVSVGIQLDQFLGPSIYTWSELQAMMRILFNYDEIVMIRNSAMAIWDREHQDGPQRGEQKYPLEDPRWDHNDAGGRANMTDLRSLIIRGIQTCVPRQRNLAKAFEVGQKKDESPSEFLDRLRESMRKYSGLDPDGEIGKSMLKVHFVTKSWPDIQKKLQKVEDWAEKDVAELLREAQKVYVQRDVIREKHKTKMMVAAVREACKSTGMGEGGYGVERGTSKKSWRGREARRGRSERGRISRYHVIP
ncbi:uncharacterized protein [Chiloscyllium punctatum]|uniref:uncharacterized protein n=1 Tax=Chiloscyllium punctatum TaxID=137246 RepID=UPI003B635D43